MNLWKRFNLNIARGMFAAYLSSYALAPLIRLFSADPNALSHLLKLAIIFPVIFFITDETPTTSKSTSPVAASIVAMAVSSIFLYLLIAKTTSDIAEYKEELRIASIECTNSKNHDSPTVGPEGLVVTLCADNDMFVFSGKSLYFEFDEKFRNEQKMLLKNKSVEDFAFIQPPMTFAGSIAQSWAIRPLSKKPENDKQPLFNAAPLEFVRIRIVPASH